MQSRDYSFAIQRLITLIVFSRLRFDCRNTQSVLESAGIICPAITRDLVKVLVDFAISHNWGDGKQTKLQEVEMA